MPRAKNTQTRTAHLPFMGGINMVAPPLTMPPGQLMDALNVMPSLDAGYQRIGGYCRFDGQEEPWRRRAMGIHLASNDGIEAGEVVSTSQGTGIVVYVDQRFNILVTMVVSGEFSVGEEIQTKRNNRIEITGIDDQYGCSLDEEKEAVESYYRDKIGKPAGDGAILGVIYDLGSLYAFREDGENVVVSKSTPSGWKGIPDHFVLPFYQSGHLPAPDDVLTSPANTDSCRVLKVVRQSGSLSDSSAAGYMLIEKLYGDFRSDTFLALNSFDGGQTLPSPLSYVDLVGDNELKMYPQVGDTVTFSSGATAVLAEPVAFEVIDTATSRLRFLLKSVTGEMEPNDLVQHTVGDDVVTLGRLQLSDIGSFVGFTPKGDDLPEVGDQIEIGSNTSRVADVLAIKQEDQTAHYYFRLQDQDGFSFTGAHSFRVNSGIGLVHKEPWLFKLKAGKAFSLQGHNFFGNAHSRRIYGCNGNSYAFELDGECILPLLAGDDGSFPHAITEHAGHLFLGYANGSVIHSVVGEPTNFSGRLGAVEIGIGDTVTALHSMPGGVLLITSRNSMDLLYGNGVQNWEKKRLADNSGARPLSVQTIGRTFALDDTGIIALDRIQSFGDFETATVSRQVQPLLAGLRDKLVGTSVFREVNQLRFYFSDGQALACKLTEGGLDITRLDYDAPITCCSHGEDVSGQAFNCFGTADGWVMRDNVGTSFDGQPVESYFQTGFAHFGTPAVRKSYKRVELDFMGEFGTKLQVSGEIDYSASHVPLIRSTGARFDLEMEGGGGFWDLDNWNEFYWSAATISSGGLPLTGTGRNISLLFAGQHTWAEPYTLFGAYIHYIPRRLHRG